MKISVLFLLVCFFVDSYGQCVTNVAIGSRTTASTTEGFRTSNFAVDGDMSSRWESQFFDPQNMTIDLGVMHNLCKVVIHWENASAKDFIVEISNDGLSWSTVGSITNNLIYTNTFNFTQSARYVRMSGTSRTTSYGYSINEFEVFGEPVVSCAVVNLASAHPGHASSEPNAGNSIANAFDNNMSTRWESVSSDPQYLYVDLGAVHPICKVILNWEAAYGRDFEIQFSNDALSWTTAYTYTNNVSLINNIPVSGSARYVRMYGTARATGFGFSLYEFQVFAANSILPVTLSYFKAIPSQNLVDLKWETKTESNSAGFEIERSASAQNGFKTIGTVKVKGNRTTPTQYSWTDLSPIAGKNFYRLKQVDLDGKFTYSEIVATETLRHDENKITSYFDKSADRIVVRTNISDPIEWVKVYSISGVPVNIHSIGNSNHKEIPVNAIPGGIYIVQIKTAKEAISKKIFIE